MHATKFNDLDLKYPKRLPRRDKNVGGMGRYSFCGHCQNLTQRHYNRAFYDWTVQALRHSERVGHSQESQIMAVRIRPLQVLKQIATMALAVADFKAHWIDDHLRRFVQNPEERHLPLSFEFYVYLNPERSGYELCQSRLEIGQLLMQVAGNRSQALVYAEIALPPLGYVVVYNDEATLLPEAAVLTNISHFGHFGYGEELSGWMSMSVRTPFGPFPLRYWQDAQKESESA
jgi:hypothetical protein